MDWKDLLYKKIEELKGEQEKANKKLEKEINNNTIFNIGKKTELMSQIQGIQMSINTLYECIGRSGEVTQ